MGCAPGRFTNGSGVRRGQVAQGRRKLSRKIVTLQCEDLQHVVQRQIGNCEQTGWFGLCDMFSLIWLPSFCMNPDQGMSKLPSSIMGVNMGVNMVL